MLNLRPSSIRARLPIPLLVLAGIQATLPVVSPARALAQEVPLLQQETARPYVLGEFIIRFRDDADVGAVAGELISRKGRFYEITGRRELDDLNDEFRVKAMRKLWHRPGGDPLGLAPGPITKSRARSHRLALRQRFERRLADLAVRFSGTRRRAVTSRDVPYPEHLYVVEIEDETADIEALCARYARDPDVEYAEPNFLHTGDFVPNDPYYADQWAHQVTQAESGWDLTLGDPSVVIAVVDTGVTYDHADLSANMLGDCTGGCPLGTGYDFVDTTNAECADVDCTVPDDDPSDDHGHGTHVSGIAAGVGNNAEGIIGICPECSIMPVRAGFRKTNGGASLESDDIFNALTYAADNGAAVVNMSFGSNSFSSTVANGVDYAYASGVVMVASAGNSSTNAYRYPGALDNVIGVGATNEAELLASFSNYGSWLDVTAPGDSIYSTDLAGYSYKSGTSMSAPYVSGLAGLILSHNPGWTNEEVRAAIRGSADPIILDAFGFTYGRVDVLAALQVQDPIQVWIDSPEAEEVFLDAASIPVFGTIQGPIASYVVDYGEGYDPTTFTSLLADTVPRSNELLGTISSPGYGVITIRIRAYNSNGDLFEDRRIAINQAPPPPLQAGWPRTVGVGGYVTSPVTLVDLDGDQDMEIVAHTLPCEVYVFDHSGNTLAGWPQPSNGDQNCQSAPAMGDVDDDGDLEIFVRANYDEVGLNRITGFHHDGTLVGGWPVDAGILFGYSKMSVSLGDIDGDQILEILYAAVNELHIREHDGASLPGWPQPAGYSTTPHAVDIDGDGDLEILSSKYGGYIFAHHHDGTMIFQERFNEDGRNVYDLAIGDLDGDGLPEVAQSYMYLLSTTPTLTSAGEVVLIDKLGNLLPGWPKQYEDPVSYLSMGNLDSDPEAELVVVNGSRVYVYDHDGTTLPGWPQAMHATVYAEAVIADIDGDGQKEVVASAENRLYAWHSDGGMLYECGFPLVVTAPAGWPSKTPAVGDIDGDGDVEIVTAGNAPSLPLSISVIDLPAPYDPAHVDWPMHEHDRLNSGHFPVPNVPPVADAGPDGTADEEQPVSLDGSGSSDPDGTIEGYAWSQLAGPIVELTDADTATASFTAPRVTGATALLFELTVTDDDGASDTATTTWTVQIVDTDADGLSDLWELDYFGDLTQGPDDDPDGDGLTNLTEFKLQTDPTVRNGAAVPALGPLGLVMLASLLGAAGLRRLRA